ncbi:MalY/PatB family protein [Kurthia sibirica]|uniref:cysteine-S-conjugate beta-lyase n=1 Tax=Kurthia sibirica TaxID=202750 RepID=A0A2U3AHW9_9BACL|nr:MalY/PatB family protein [Kurthia sibirica]PWI24152.1 pyridoxal phosphate-dependent aminotransferase [Kurthia sibirica]GEK34676.1 cystathionine beta-lyase PatB [Kurthia sibirica]
MSHFNQTFNRKNTASLKWDLMEKVYTIPDASSIIPMWVADMDFAAPSFITESLKARLDFPLFGYTFENEACATAVTSWVKRRHNWHIHNDDIMYHQGVVPAIATIIEAFTTEDDAVIVNSPVYPPFFNIPRQLGRTVVSSPFIEKKGRLYFDFDHFERLLQDDKVKIFVFCHPHNPAGRVWSQDELVKIDALCAANNVLIISDEIHCDLMLNGEQHIPLAKVSATPDNIITCMAPTKTFNIAGIQASMMITSDAKKRLKIQNTLAKHGQMGLNTFAITAVQAAFSDAGIEWLNDLIPYLNANLDYAIDTIEKALPNITITKPDATYLMWIDIRKTGIAEKEIMQKLLDAGVALDPGTKYGADFDGFLRMNIACTRQTLEQGVERFIKAFN